MEAKGDTAFVVVAGDDERRGLDELKLQLGAAGVGEARGEVRMKLLLSV
jgi:hypothetical protein